MIAFIIHRLAHLFAKDQSPEGLAELDAQMKRDLTGVRKEYWVAYGVVLLIVLFASFYFTYIF